MEERKQIVACLMVKDEERIIERCLRSVIPLVDMVFVLDTGSTDNTKRIVHNLTGPNSIVLSSGWEGFGPTRNKLIKRASDTFPGAWLLLVDADYVLETTLKSPDELSSLLDPAVAGYTLRWSGALSYSNTKLINSSFPWHYVGRTHEFITTDVRQKIEHLDRITIDEKYDGANRPGKFERDIQLLKEDLADPEYKLKDRARFYLGRSYYDLGKFEEALPFFIQAAEDSTWSQQRYMSYLQAGRCAVKLNLNAFHHFAAAAYEDPDRSESIYELMLLELKRKNWLKVINLYSAHRAVEKFNANQLFVEQDIRAWKLKDAMALALYYNGNKEEAKNYWLRTLEEELPPADRGRITGNVGVWCK